jgi:hypothetical protein
VRDLFLRTRDVGLRRPGGLVQEQRRSTCLMMNDDAVGLADGDSAVADVRGGYYISNEAIVCAGVGRIGSRRTDGRIGRWDLVSGIRYAAPWTVWRVSAVQDVAEPAVCLRRSRGTVRGPLNPASECFGRPSGPRSGRLGVNPSTCSVRRAFLRWCESKDDSFVDAEDV